MRYECPDEKKLLRVKELLRAQSRISSGWTNSTAQKVCVGYRTAAPTRMTVTDMWQLDIRDLIELHQTHEESTTLVSHFKGQNMEVPPMVWADLPRIVLCVVAIILCEKLWNWILCIQINVDKPKHEVSLPELVTNLVSMTEAAKPVEENEKYTDMLEQNEGTRPKILAVSLRDPKKDATAAAAGMQQSPDEWSAAPPSTNLPNMDTAMAPPSYASTNGHGMPIVYDREGLNEAQQMTLENLCRCRARNQQQRWKSWAKCSRTWMSESTGTTKTCTV